LIICFPFIPTRFLRSTVPGKPEVDVHLAEDATIELSWKLKCKNGVIKEFHVTYFRVDDTAESETLTTKETKVQIEGLTAGKTFEFQVSCWFLFKFVCFSRTMFLLPYLIHQFNHLSIGLDQDYFIIAMDICKDEGRKPAVGYFDSQRSNLAIHCASKEAFCFVNSFCDQTGQAHSYLTCMLICAVELICKVL